MSLVSFTELMKQAASGNYAVGYFESWNLESLQAVADAAEATRSPVLLGFSGINLPDPARRTHEDLALYAAMGLEACRRLTVPACLLFNESSFVEWVERAITLGFGLVMFTDDSLGYDGLVSQIRRLAGEAHRAGAAIEAELLALAGVGDELSSVPDDLRYTDPALAEDLVKRTGIDALAINVGQVHVHNRARVRLDLGRLEELRSAVDLPLVLHGASSVDRDDIAAAIRLGVRKVNVGSLLKRTYFDALRRACAEIVTDYNPYEVVGSGLSEDVLTTARLAMQRQVEELMTIFGSVGQAAPRTSEMELSCDL